MPEPVIGQRAVRRQAGLRSGGIMVRGRDRELAPLVEVVGDPLELAVGHESAILLRRAVARAIHARSFALRACSRWSSQALRWARAALASSSPSAVVLKSTLRRSSGSPVRTA